MIVKRALVIALLMLVGLLITSISLWSLVFDATSGNTPAWSVHWIVERAPILIGLLIIFAGIRLLGSTRVRRPVAIDEDPAP